MLGRDIITSMLGLVVGAILGYGLGHYLGKDEGKELQVAKQNTATLEKVVKNEKKLYKNNSLSTDELKRSYCHWVFDVSYDECIKSVVFVD